MIIKRHLVYQFIKNTDWLLKIASQIDPNIPEEKDLAIAYLSGEECPDISFYTWKLISPENNRVYVFSKKAFEIVGMIKEKTKESLPDFTVFTGLPDRKMTIVIGDKSFYRISFDQGTIAICSVIAGIGKDLDFFWVKTDNNEYGSQKERELNFDIGHLWRILCFLLIAEIDEVVVNGFSKTGQKSNDKIVNDSDFPVTLVTSRWNSKVIREESFSVSGHFAIRRTGKGRVSHKLVFIEPFFKHGYKRNAQKLTDNQK